MGMIISVFHERRIFLIFKLASLFPLWNATQSYNFFFIKTTFILNFCDFFVIFSDYCLSTFHFSPSIIPLSGILLSLVVTLVVKLNFFQKFLFQSFLIGMRLLSTHSDFSFSPFPHFCPALVVIFSKFDNKNATLFPTYRNYSNNPIYLPCMFAVSVVYVWCIFGVCVVYL